MQISLLSVGAVWKFDRHHIMKIYEWLVEMCEYMQCSSAYCLHSATLLKHTTVFVTCLYIKFLYFVQDVFLTINNYYLKKNHESLSLLLEKKIINHYYYYYWNKICFCRASTNERTYFCFFFFFWFLDSIYIWLKNIKLNFYIYLIQHFHLVWLLIKFENM